MRRVTATLGAAMILLASAAAAQKPDFSGKWTVDQEKTTAANPGMAAGGGAPGGAPGGRGMGGGMGGAMTLKLDGNTLIQEREGPNGAISTSYVLDGSTQTVSMGQRSGSAKAMWEGSTIVLETTFEGPNGAMTTKTIYAMEGDWLVLSRAGRDGAMRKTYYKKS